MTVIVVITAFIATILGSISGIGGGVIIKPVMDAILDLSASTISFLSGTTVLTMTIVSLLRSRGGETKVDRRGTFLAVGGAVGHNSISIIIPCHRVVGSDGNLTGYAGGIDKKVQLLELEDIDTTEFTIPTNITAHIHLPDGRTRMLSAGTHRL